MTGTFAALAADPKVCHVEALQKSMVAMINGVHARIGPRPPARHMGKLGHRLGDCSDYPFLAAKERIEKALGSCSGT